MNIKERFKSKIEFVEHMLNQEPRVDERIHEFHKYEITEKEVKHCKNYYYYGNHCCCDEWCGRFNKHSASFKDKFNNLHYLFKDEIENGTFKKMKYSKFLKTPYWFYVSLYIKYDRDYKCEICNSRYKKLNIHHNDYSIRGEEHRHVYDREKFLCVCEDCHREIHGIRG